MRKIVLSAVALLAFYPLYAQEKPVSVSFQTQDEWRIAASYQPAQEDKKTVLLLHDVAKSRTAFAAFEEKLTELGFGWLALDLRGHGESVNKGDYKTFAKEGVDNDYNKMTRDVNAAMDFLKGKGVREENVVFIGAGMGANVAAKAASLWPSVSGLALLTPVTNLYDVLPIAALRVYKGNVFIAAAADDKKTFLEASVMRNVAFLTSGEGKVVFATAYDKKGHELLDAWVTPELLQWLQTPDKPELKPDLPPEPEEDVDSSYEPVESSGTEEALFPSILQ